MTDHPPAPARQFGIAVAQPLTLVPGVIGDAGAQASWRFVDFCTANIRNPNTRRACLIPWIGWNSPRSVVKRRRNSTRAKAATRWRGRGGCAAEVHSTHRCTP